MDYDEKLEHFATDIMADVNKKRKNILDEIDHDYQVKYNLKETEYLTEAYEIIQSGLKKIDKEKNEIISKTMMDNKIALLNKRITIIKNIYHMAKTKLNKFTKSEAYHDYLFDMVTVCIEAIGPGKLEVIINHSDKLFKDEIVKRFNCDVTIESEKIDLIGGCKIMNHTTNIFLDDTLATRLESQRENFVKECKIDIEL